IEGDPTTSSPVDPPPDPYIEGDPTTSSPVDPPPDPYIEGDPTTSSPVDPPPDPYIEGGASAGGGTEYQSVMPAHAKAGAGRLTDDNSALAYQLWGAVPPTSGLRFEYHAASQPAGLGGRGFHAAKRALAAWDKAAGRRYLKVSYFSRGTRGPARDGHNTISWRVFTGPETDALAAAWIWDDGSRIVEVDLALNLRRAFAINATISPGEARRGSSSGYDLQALLTHELGHGLGLADLTAPGTEGATMYGELAPGELAAQTLSQGDQRGLRAALGRPIRRPGKP
ncbi:MAG: hypothetical protein IT204_18420, partial [Fimbriimonadaceae bacterium]|nr:hypothetical protein [Fimbriimonadaceae bacterium]